VVIPAIALAIRGGGVRVPFGADEADHGHSLGHLASLENLILLLDATRFGMVLGHIGAQVQS
jgi:hypothetical protein